MTLCPVRTENSDTINCGAETRDIHTSRLLDAVHANRLRPVRKYWAILGADASRRVSLLVAGRARPPGVPRVQMTLLFPDGPYLASSFLPALS